METPICISGTYRRPNILYRTKSHADHTGTFAHRCFLHVSQHPDFYTQQLLDTETSVASPAQQNHNLFSDLRPTTARTNGPKECPARLVPLPAPRSQSHFRGWRKRSGHHRHLLPGRGHGQAPKFQIYLGSELDMEFVAGGNCYANRQL